MANSFSYDSTDLDTLGLNVQPYNEPWMPIPNLSKARPPQGQAEFHGVNYQEGMIILDCVVRGSSVSDLHSKMDAIVLLLDPTLGNKRIDLDEITDRFWYARLVSGIQAPQKGQMSTTFQLHFETVEHGYSITEDDNSFTIASNPDSFTVDSGGAIGGTAPTTPVWYIRNTVGSNVTGDILLKNDTLGDPVFKWNGTLEDDRWLRIGSILLSSGRFLYTLRKSDGTGNDPTIETYTNVISGYRSGDWPILKPNVQNTMTVTGLSAGTVRWVYRDRFI